MRDGKVFLTKTTKPVDEGLPKEILYIILLEIILKSNTSKTETRLNCMGDSTINSLEQQLTDWRETVVDDGEI